MSSEVNFAIKFNNNTYFIGNGQVSPELREAKQYKVSKYAEQEANEFMKKLHTLFSYKNNSKDYITINSYKIIRVKIEELDV